MKKIKDLEAKDFSGVNIDKFQEWKNAHKKFTKQSNVLGFILLFSMLLIIIFREQFLPAIVFGIALISGVVFIISATIKTNKTRKELGVTSKDLREVFKK